jgi:hypothetical protein
MSATLATKKTAPASGRFPLGRYGLEFAFWRPQGPSLADSASNDEIAKQAGLVAWRAFRETTAEQRAGFGRLTV